MNTWGCSLTYKRSRYAAMVIWLISRLLAVSTRTLLIANRLTMHEEVIVRAAVRNRCWILVEGGPNSHAAGNHFLSNYI